MFKTRLLSGIVLVIAALVLIITGGDLLLVSALIISWIGMFELYRSGNCRISVRGGVLCESALRISAGYDGVCPRDIDGADVRLCVHLSEI